MDPSLSFQVAVTNEDEINTLQSDIKEHEKSLAIERYELRQLFDEKRRLLKLG